jgi:hypothetical protein
MCSLKRAFGYIAIDNKHALVPDKLARAPETVLIGKRKMGVFFVDIYSTFF